jgi:hypothetical protein
MKRFVIALVLLLLAACSDGNESTTPQAQAPTTTVKAPTAKTPTARALIEGFKQRGLPVGKVVCYNDENDPNDLLNRPGGYVEKCDWADKREQSTTEPTTAQGKLCSDPDIDPLDKELCENAPKEEVDLIGGSIETYEEPEGAATRAEKLRAFEGGLLSTGYTFTPKNDKWVLRVDKELTKAQAQAYLNAFLAQI